MMLVLICYKLVVTNQQISKKLNIFLNVLVIANAVTLIPAVIFMVLGILNLGYAEFIDREAAQGTGMAIGLFSIPFIFGSVPVLLANIIALPIILSKYTLSPRVIRNFKILLGFSLAAIVLPLLILIVNNLVINPQ